MAHKDGDSVSKMVLQADAQELFLDLRSELEDFRRDFGLQMAESRAYMRGLMVKCFVPLLIGVYATLAVVVWSIIARR